MRPFSYAGQVRPAYSMPLMYRRPPDARTCTTMSMVVFKSCLMVSKSKPAPSGDALTINASWSQVCRVLPAWQLVMEPGWPDAQLRKK